MVFTCRWCKEEKEDESHTMLKEEDGFLILFTPLCENCFKEFSEHSVNEVIELRKNKK